MVLPVAVASLFAAGAGQRPTPAVNLNPSVTITVDAAANRHPIDERIYGTSFASAAAIADLGITMNRWGGNHTSRHNWAINVTNRAKDYYFENLQDPVSVAGVPGQAVDDFIKPTFDNGAQPVITIPMMGLLPFDTSLRCGFSVAKYAAQTSTNGDCGSGHFPPAPDTNANRMRQPAYPIDPADTTHVYTSAHQGDWIQHLVGKWGAAAGGGVRYYGLDNEPALWSFDHWDIHPQGSTYNEVWAKWQDYGLTIKTKDPDALLTGPEEYGWSGYFASGTDIENGDNADRLAHGNKPYIQWLLEQANAYEHAPGGKRILDVLTVHFYPQGNADGSHQEIFTTNPDGSQDISPECQALRNRSTRSLWDPAYVNESWIGGTGINGGIVRLIPMMKEWVQNYYPGTQIGLTEYNWGADNHINGGTAQADILGILGREGPDMAIRWDTPPDGSNTYNAFKMYRNYDGLHSKFGNLSVSAGGPNPDHMAAFAALRSSDGALTVMVIAKVPTGDTPVTVNLSNYLPSGNAQRWQLDAGNAITRVMPDVALAGTSLSLTVPPQSITLLVVPGSYLDAPTGVLATASSTSNVTVNWTAAAGTMSYQIFRSSANGPFSLLGTAAGTTYGDAPLSADTTYLYKVRAVSGTVVSPLSAVDPATTTIFTDDPLNAGTIATAAHITQLRTAVNAMRAAAGLPAQVFTDSPLTAGTLIKAMHITQLRTALDQARAAIGISAATYTDPTITPGSTTLKAAHLTRIRSAVK